MWIRNFILALAIVVSPLLKGDLFEFNLDLLNGYRHDTLSTHVNVFNHQGELIVQDHLKARNLSLYQLGGKAFFEAFGVFARGEGYWGWSDQGIYRECSRIVRQNPPTKSKANLHKGRTRDFTIGGGYLFSYCGLLSIGPAGGWSYQYQQFKINRANIKHTNYSLRGLQYSNHWQGPWAGIDARADLCAFAIRAGYEYHWAKWNSKWAIKDAEDVSFAVVNKQSCSNAHGNVAYADVIWTFCPFIELGVCFKWQQWIVKNSKKKPSIGDFDPRNIGKVKNADWTSYSISFALGVAF